MAYQVYWIIHHHVLHIRFADDLQLDDLRDSSRLIADHIGDAYDNAPQNVITGVVDMSAAHLGSLLRTMLSLLVKQIADVIDPRIWKAKPGFVVLITKSEHAQTAVSLVVKLSSQPMTTVATLDEALTVVGAMYPELQAELDTFRRQHGSANSPS
jgi:hypothetical protein